MVPKYNSSHSPLIDLESTITSMATLSTPFRSFSTANFLSRGSAGQVFVISRNVVFKCPTVFNNPAPQQADEMKESRERMENEMAVYEVLMKHRHPNIVHGILCVPQGLFMQRLQMTLESRIAEQSMSAISPDTQEKWIQQLTSGLAWLENLGFIHGDLRPANILLDAMENIKIGDFDATVKRGEQLIVASEPFCKLDAEGEPSTAGPVSEQFSLGSCIYNIRFGHVPLHELDPPTRVQRLRANEFPSTSGDTLFGDLTRGCWHGTYNSIGEIEQDVYSRIHGHHNLQLLKNGSSGSMDDVQSNMLLAECKDFLASEEK